MGRIDVLRRSRSGLLVGLTAASVGVIAGYDQSSIGGALLYITDGFHLATNQQELVTTAVVIGQIAGALGGGVLANAIGRKHSMLVVVTTYAVFAVVSAVSVSVAMLVVARLLVGVAIGVSFVVVPVYIAESAPAKVRGFLLVSYQMVIIVGIVPGYLIAYLLAGWQSWRWMLGLAAVPAVLVMLPLRRLSDTARWYMLKGRVADASHALQRIEPDTDVEKELIEITQALEEDRGSALAEMLRRPYLRATVFVVGLGFLSQATGINAIISYGPRLLEKMGFTGNFALLVLPAVVQVIALAAVFVSMELVDRLGRRPVLLSGIAMMGAASLLLIGVFVVDSALRALGFLAVLLFGIGYNVGFGSIVSVYAGESLPSRLRSIGSGAMFASDRLANAIVAGVFLTMLHSLGGAGTFALFGVLAVGSFAFVYRLAPETKGRQLEDIRHFWENGGKHPTEQTAALSGAGVMTATAATQRRP